MIGRRMPGEGKPTEEGGSALLETPGRIGRVPDARWVLREGDQGEPHQCGDHTVGEIRRTSFGDQHRGRCREQRVDLL